MTLATDSRRPRGLAAPILALFLLTIAGAAVAAVAPSDSVKFSLRAEGESIGRFSLWKVAQEDGSILYGGSGVMRRTTKMHWTAKLSADLGTLLATTGSIKSTERNIFVRAVMASGGGVPEGEIDFNGMKIPLEEKIPADVVYISSGAPTGLAPLSDRLAEVDPATYVWKGRGSDGSMLLDLEIAGEGVQEIDVNGRTTTVRVFGLTADAKGMPQPLKVTFYQLEDGSFFGMRQGGTTAFRLGGPNAEAAVSESEDLTVETPGGAVEGTLTLPLEGAPWPAVLLVAGPGQEGRDARHDGFGVYAAMAEGLAVHGIATLRCEPAEAASLGAYAAAAAAALRTLADHPDVAPDKLLLLGFDAAAMVLGEVAETAAADSLAVRAVASLGGVTVVGAEIHAAVPRTEDAPWFADFSAYDPRPRFAAAGLPVLLLHGGLDDRVPVATVVATRDWLKENGLKKVSLTKPKTMDHGLRKPVDGDEASLRAFGQGVIKRVAGFVKANTR